MSDHILESILDPAAAAHRLPIFVADRAANGPEATPDELHRSRGTSCDGLPVGLAPCPACAEARGECLDANPDFPGRVMQVHCRCDDGNRCARCGERLHERNSSMADELLARHCHTLPATWIRRPRAGRSRQPEAGVDDQEGFGRRNPGMDDGALTSGRDSQPADDATRPRLSRASPEQMRLEVENNPDLAAALRADVFAGSFCVRCGSRGALFATPVWHGSCPRCLADPQDKGRDDPAVTPSTAPAPSVRGSHSRSP